MKPIFCLSAFLALAGAAALALAGAAAAQPAKIGTTNGSQVLQTPAGKTLYVYDQDKVTGGQKGHSACNKDCVALWPPFTVTGDAKPAGDWSVITRDDGSKQWAYKDRPLYTWSKDTQPGQVDGASFEGNAWHPAKP